jgi:hypothetical protein
MLGIIDHMTVRQPYQSSALSRGPTPHPNAAVCKASHNSGALTVHISPFISSRPVYNQLSAAMELHLNKNHYIRPKPRASKSSTSSPQLHVA